MPKTLHVELGEQTHRRLSVLKESEGMTWPEFLVHAGEAFARLRAAQREREAAQGHATSADVERRESSTRRADRRSPEPHRNEPDVASRESPGPVDVPDTGDDLRPPLGEDDGDDLPSIEERLGIDEKDDDPEVVGKPSRADVSNEELAEWLEENFR